MSYFATASTGPQLADGEVPIWEQLPHGEVFYPHTPAERAINITSLCINIINLIGNVFIFYLFYAERSLRENRTMLILNLALGDFIWGGSAGVTEFWNAIVGGFGTGRIGCSIVLSLSAGGIAVSMQTLMWISVDRFVHIVWEKPFSVRALRVVVATIWTVSASYVIWLFFAAEPAGGAVLAVTHTYCDAPWMYPSPLMRSAGWFTIGCFVTFISVMAICYFAIYRKFRRVRKRMMDAMVPSVPDDWNNTKSTTRELVVSTDRKMSIPECDTMTGTFNSANNASTATLIIPSIVPMDEDGRYPPPPVAPPRKTSQASPDEGFLRTVSGNSSPRYPPDDFGLASPTTAVSPSYHGASYPAARIYPPSPQVPQTNIVVQPRKESNSFSANKNTSATSSSANSRRREYREHRESQAVVFKFVTLVSVFSFTWGFWVMGVVCYQMLSGNDGHFGVTAVGALMSYVNAVSVMPSTNALL
ncbi:hypothetical protein BC832DRAFT_107783 [Gaertneriomyces semiglobifer]|nr:hypothetical protein BC832DRAFT_107783 [Gaertneriomyces semiglobifer]